MSDSGHDPAPRRDWKLIVAAVLALALVIGVIAYKYTGDFTGVVKFHAAGRPGYYFGGGGCLRVG